jgi:transcriptional regulator with XRE-family HTH domain
MYVCVSVRTARVDNSETPRLRQLAWVQAILAHTGWTQTELARRAKVDPSTLSRFLREVNPGANLNQTTIAALERVGGIPAFDTEPPQLPRGFAESEAQPFIAMPGDPMAAAVQALIAMAPGVDPWVMKSRALETAGFLPGDILIVDLNAAPRDGDAVCAQVYDRSGKAETVFRIYEHPFLVAASHDPDLRRPVLADNDRAQVRGVVTATLRPRLTN